MKKTIFALFFLFTCSVCHSGFELRGTPNKGFTPYGVTTTLQQLLGLGNLTFFKDYSALPVGTVTASQLDADYAGGSATATYTSARSASAPATYVDSNGVIQLVTTADVGRIQGGFYDSTGFHLLDSNSKTARGLMIEAAGTNLFTMGSFTASTNWADGVNGDYLRSVTTNKYELLVDYAAGARTTNTISADSKYINSALINITNGGAAVDDVTLRGEVISLANATTYTVSFWVKTNTAKTIPYDIIEYDDDKTVYNDLGTFTTVANTWIRITKSFSGLVGGSDVTDAVLFFNLGNLGAFQFYFESMQIEASPYATSFIPTTTAALTRPAEVLKYAIAGNRTAASESLFVGFALNHNSSSQTTTATILDSDTKRRIVYVDVTSDSLGFYPNQTDSGTSTVIGTTDPLANTSYLYTAIAYGETAGTNSETYINGTSEATNTTNYTAPVWGTNFSVGSKALDGSLLVDGTVKSLTFYSDAKDSTAVGNITTILNN